MSFVFHRLYIVNQSMILGDLSRQTKSGGEAVKAFTFIDHLNRLDFRFWKSELTRKSHGLSIHQLLFHVEAHEETGFKRRNLTLVLHRPSHHICDLPNINHAVGNDVRTR